MRMILCVIKYWSSTQIECDSSPGCRLLVSEGDISPGYKLMRAIPDVIEYSKFRDIRLQILKRTNKVQKVGNFNGKQKY